jgi:hypothetical protein
MKQQTLFPRNLLWHVERRLTAKNPTYKFNMTKWLCLPDHLREQYYFNIPAATIEDILSTPEHLCETSACIAGHVVLAAVELKIPLIEGHPKYVALDLLNLTKNKEIDVALSDLFGDTFFWHKSLRHVTNTEAANVVRHLRVHQTIPNSYQTVEQHYKEPQV